jgi:hypothetical protein
MSVVSSFFHVRVVELSVLTLHSSVTVLPTSFTTTRGFVIEIAVISYRFITQFHCQNRVKNS